MGGGGMETLKILISLHNMPGAGYYEASLAVAIGSLVAQYYLKKRGNEEGANLVKGLTLLGLGAICVEAVMTMLHLIGNILT